MTGVSAPRVVPADSIGNFSLVVRGDGFGTAAEQPSELRWGTAKLPRALVDRGAERHAPDEHNSPWGVGKTDLNGRGGEMYAPI